MARCSILTMALLATLWAGSIAAQHTVAPDPDDPGSRDAVLAVVQELFDAMADGDLERVGTVLLPEGQWVSVRPGPDGGDDVVAVLPHGEVLVQLGQARERWLERMWDPVVMVHGPLAVVWTPYDFHIGDTFSHCGMDAVTLVRVGARWLIAGATYTVEPHGCPPSPLGPPSQ
jgi:hypothetical protein